MEEPRHHIEGKCDWEKKAYNIKKVKTGNNYKETCNSMREKSECNIKC